MSASVPSGPNPRQLLSPRQSATVDSLLRAGIEAINDHGFNGFSLRDVAARANVTHTTAYNYFTSKEHLVAEIHWRHLSQLTEPTYDPTQPLAERLVAALVGAGEPFLQNPRMAEAALAAMVIADPEIQRIRDDIASLLFQRLRIAAGPDTDATTIEGALLLYSGTMLQAGLGYFSFDDALTRFGTVIQHWART